MKQIEVSIKEINCEESELNNFEVDYWEKVFMDRKSIPSPHININNNNNVVAFHNCFFALRNLGLSKTWCVLVD